MCIRDSYEAMLQFGIELSWAEIRKPMGAFKPTHLRMLMSLPEFNSCLLYTSRCV